jgi:hypothetical protein
LTDCYNYLIIMAAAFDDSKTHRRDLPCQDMKLHEILDITLESGIQLTQLPESLTLDRPYLAFKSNIKRNKKGLRVERELLDKTPPRLRKTCNNRRSTNAGREQEAHDGKSRATTAYSQHGQCKLITGQETLDSGAVVLGPTVNLAYVETSRAAVLMARRPQHARHRQV